MATYFNCTRCCDGVAVLVSDEYDGYGPGYFSAGNVLSYTETSSGNYVCCTWVSDEDTETSAVGEISSDYTDCSACASGEGVTCPAYWNCTDCCDGTTVKVYSDGSYSTPSVDAVISYYVGDGSSGNYKCCVFVETTTGTGTDNEYSSDYSSCSECKGSESVSCADDLSCGDGGHAIERAGSSSTIELFPTTTWLTTDSAAMAESQLHVFKITASATGVHEFSTCRGYNANGHNATCDFDTAICSFNSSYGALDDADDNDGSETAAECASAESSDSFLLRPDKYITLLFVGIVVAMVVALRLLECRTGYSRLQLRLQPRPRRQLTLRRRRRRPTLQILLATASMLMLAERPH